MPIIESVIEKKFGDGKPYWIAVIDGNEIPCYDPIIKDHKGKENPYEIATSGTGKKYLKVPKAGFQGKGGGFSRGKSDREIYLSALTMAMSYSKDVICAMIAHGYEFETNIESTLLSGYKKISQAILADLKAIEGEAPKVPEKPPASVPQGTSAPKPDVPPPAENVNLPIKKKLEKEMWAYLRNMHSDTDANFEALLIELTEFDGKNKQGEPEKVFVKSLDDPKFSDKWAGRVIGNLRTKVEEEERKNVANADLGDIPY